MLELEIDGRTIEVPEGSTVMDAANQLGIYIPHFCYHKKLTIAANCRMCLVQVEKAPKPLPAYATPVTEGMKVQTHSPLAVDELIVLTGLTASQVLATLSVLEMRRLVRRLPGHRFVRV